MSTTEPTATSTTLSSQPSISKKSRSKKFKEASKDMKLKLFLKRSSEPVLNGLPATQQPVIN